MPHAEVGVQNDPIHAIVAAVQQILIESAKSIAHARYATSTPLSLKLPRRGHFFEARSAKKRRLLIGRKLSSRERESGASSSGSLDSGLADQPSRTYLGRCRSLANSTI